MTGTKMSSVLALEGQIWPVQVTVHSGTHHKIICWYVSTYTTDDILVTDRPCHTYHTAKVLF